MCPDVSTLSAFYDGELEGKTAATVEAHVASCDACRGVLSGFEKLSTSIKRIEEVDASAFANRSRRHVETRAMISTRKFPRLGTISIPSPVIAIAALLVVLLSMGVLFSSRRGSARVRTTQGTAAAAFDQVVKFLDSQKSAEPAVFVLPDKARLRVVSEPRFVRAAEYDRTPR